MKVLTKRKGNHVRLLKLRLSLLAAVLLLAAAQLLTASPALAAQLQVDGGIINLTAQPGDVYEHTFTVQSGSGDRVQEMLVEAAGFGQELDGSYYAIPAAEDSYPRSARDFIADIDKPSFTLNPGPSGAKEVTVRIEVPQEIGDGGYYAIVYVHSLPSGDEQVGTVLAFNIPVVLTVKDTERTTGGEIADLTAGEVADEETIVVSTVFENTGNYHYKARNSVTIMDSAGDQVAEASVPLTSSSIVPGYAYGFEAPLLGMGGISELPAGRYEIISEVIGEDGVVRDTETLVLNLDDDYKFPEDSGDTGVDDGDGGIPYLLWIAVALGVLALIIIGAVLYHWGRRSGSKGKSGKNGKAGTKNQSGPQKRKGSRDDDQWDDDW